MTTQEQEYPFYPSPWTLVDEPIDGEEDILIEHEGCLLATVRGSNDMSCIDEDDLEKINQDVIATAKLIIKAPDMFHLIRDLVDAMDMAEIPPVNNDLYKRACEILKVGKV